MWPFDLLPATAQRIITVIFYAAIALGCAWFAVITSRKPAPTRARETFRTPGRIRAGLPAVCRRRCRRRDPAAISTGLADSASGRLAGSRHRSDMDRTRMYSRAADAYPAGKHADPATPPESRWPLKRRSQR
jgi:hypothetical protein